MDKSHHACLVCACYSPVQWHDIVLLVQRSCLCRIFVTTGLVSLYDEESVQTLDMLDVDEYSLKELFNVSYTHTIYHICLL